MTEDRVIPGGTPKWAREYVAPDANKTFTVPTGKRWVLKYVGVFATTSASAGDRRFGMEIVASGAVVFEGAKCPAVAASKTATIQWGVGLQYDTTVGYHPKANAGDPDFALSSPIPEFTLNAGNTITLQDMANVHIAGDTMNVDLYYIEYDA